MAFDEYLEIDYVVADPVISAARVGTDETVRLHASVVQQAYDTQSHVTRSGVLSETIHIVTMDLVTVTVPVIFPGQGADDRGRSRSDNVREMLRSVLRGNVVTLRPVGASYLIRLPGPLEAKLEGTTAGLEPVRNLDYFTLSLRFRQSGYVTSDFG